MIAAKLAKLAEAIRQDPRLQQAVAQLAAIPAALNARAAELAEIEAEQQRLRQITGCSVGQAHETFLLLQHFAAETPLQTRELWDTYVKARIDGLDDWAAWGRVHDAVGEALRRQAGLAG